jgi:lipoprotein-releasing system permease protein
VLENDSGMNGKLLFEAGSFDLAGMNSILLGTELALRIGARPGDEISLYSLSNIIPAMAGAETDAGEGADAGERFIVRGLFRCGFYEYDASWAFINIERALAMEDDESRVSVGVKLKNRYADTAVEQEIKKILVSQTARNETMAVSSWRNYNRAFFGALRTEKVFMFVLLFLIFVVVAVNIFQSQRRLVLEKRDEIGLLRAIGATDRAVRGIFLCNGFIIGLTGALAGMAPALLITLNINFFFGLLETAVNGLIDCINYLVFMVSGGGGGGIEGGSFAVFSPAVFYIKEIPARVLAREVLVIFLSGLFSATAAAWFASGRISKIQPAEVLRYE